MCWYCFIGIVDFHDFHQSLEWFVFFSIDSYNEYITNTQVPDHIESDEDEAVNYDYIDVETLLYNP